ncbi:MAG: hypothetical protein KF810_15995 [Rhizobiaceae bacterium]|nr:hypothetical protein [Rhizobiaceae bacterium]
MPRPGPRSSIVDATNRPKINFGDEDWQMFEKILDRKLSFEDREALLVMYIEFAASQYAANRAPLLSEVRSHLVDLHKQASDLRAGFLFENVSKTMRVVLTDLLGRAYWRQPFDCTSAHFFSDQRNEYGSPKGMLSPARGEIPHRVIHSDSSVAEFLRSIAAAAEDAVREVDDTSKDPSRFGFDKIEPQKKLIRSMRAWAKHAGIPYSGKRADGSVSGLVELILSGLSRLPAECQPDKPYKPKAIARRLQSSICEPK